MIPRTTTLVFAVSSSVLASFAAVALKFGWSGLGSPCADCCDRTEEAQEDGAPSAKGVRGRYVEARTASVFAGACHYNGELVTAGHSALLAWQIEAGELEGVDLSGLGVVLLVTSDQNLALGGARRSILWIPAAAGAQQGGMLRHFVEAQMGDALGTLIDVRNDSVDVRLEGERYSVRVGAAIELEGALDPDRACCKMPQSVWYEPLVPLEGRIVGASRLFRVAAPGLDLEFTRRDQNDSFSGEFDLVPEPATEALVHCRHCFYPLDLAD